MADFEDHVVIFSILFLCFRFLSRCSRLRQSLFLLMRTTQISKAVLSTMMLISRRRQSGLRHRRMNRLRVWVYPRDQRWFGEIHRNPARTMFQVSKFLAKSTDLGMVTRIAKDTSNPAEQYNCC